MPFQHAKYEFFMRLRQFYIAIWLGAKVSPTADTTLHKSALMHCQYS